MSFLSSFSLNKDNPHNFPQQITIEKLVKLIK